MTPSSVPPASTLMGSTLLNCFLPVLGKAAAALDYPIQRPSYFSEGFSTHRHSITESHEMVMEPESFLADD